MPGVKAHLSEKFIVESDSDSENIHNGSTAKKPALDLRKLIPLGESRSDSSKKRKHESTTTSSTGSGVSHTSVSASRGDNIEEGSGSASHGSSSGSDEDEDEEQLRKDDNASDEEPSRRALATTRSILSEPAIPYKPPVGFGAATISQISSEDLRRSFGKHALQGKQIWYITAPASVPFSSIKEVSTRQIAEGGSILSYKGAEYGLMPEVDTGQKEKLLLVPSPEDNHYRLAGAQIEKTLHLQQLVKGPASTHREGVLTNGATKAPKTHVKMVRQQPEGLRMRYQPFGYQSSSEDTDKASKFKRPPIVSAAHSLRAKRSSADKCKPLSPKAQIKNRNSPEKTKLTNGVSEALSLAQGSSFDNPKEEIGSESQINHLPSFSPKPKETSEEKIRRRAERKRRKEMRDGEPKRISDQLEERSLATKTNGNRMAVNGVVGIRHISPEVAIPKTKRKKRKSEAIEDA
ncbi:MAG: hypothetical protein Q9178_005078 [Gyalolechia marmorata]